MPRPLRILAPDTAYHITAGGNNGEVVFQDDVDRHGYLRLLEQLSRLMRIELMVYVLMTNHIHLIVWTVHANLSAFVQRVHGIYAGRFNRRYGRTGHLFEGRFYSKVIEDDAYLLAASRYIHRNPVLAGLSETPAGYRWTSYLAYKRPLAGSFVNPSRVLAAISPDEGRARREYARLVEGDCGPLTGPGSWQAVLAGSLGYDLETLSRSRKAAEVRAMILFLLKQRTGALPKRLGEVFGMSSSAVCNSVARLARKLENPGTAARLEKVKNVLTSLNLNLPI